MLENRTKFLSFFTGHEEYPLAFVIEHNTISFPVNLLR